MKRMNVCERDQYTSYAIGFVLVAVLWWIEPSIGVLFGIATVLIAAVAAVVLFITYGIGACEAVVVKLRRNVSRKSVEMPSRARALNI